MGDVGWSGPEEGWKCCWVLISGPVRAAGAREVEERGLLAAGSFLRLRDGPWTPHSWARGCSWMRPCCHGTLGMGALGRQKQPLGGVVCFFFCPAMILRGRKILHLLRTQVLQGWVSCSPCPGPAPFPSPPPTRGQWGPELVPLYWGVPDSHPPLRRVWASQKPPPLLGKVPWGRGRTLDRCWDSDSGGAGGLPWGQTEAPAEC